MIYRYKDWREQTDAGSQGVEEREVLRAGGIRSGSSKQKATTLEREDLIVRSKREAIKEEHEGGG